MRRVSIETKAIKPRTKISAALIPWGQPPAGERDFEDVAPMQRIYQDWHQWMKDGLIDLGVPMNYATETCALRSASRPGKSPVPTFADSLRPKGLERVE